MTADLLALLESDPAAGILAVADDLDQLAELAEVDETVAGCAMLNESSPATNTLLARCSPTFLRAVVRRWRGVVERHVRSGVRSGGGDVCCWCCSGIIYEPAWPCPDLSETADEARAYLGGAS